MPSDLDMRAHLERLPPGHPSSPWDADGRRRPPPPWLEELELPLPGHWPGGPDPVPGRPDPAVPASGPSASENFEK